jgi:hypothetical protein
MPNSRPRKPTLASGAQIDDDYTRRVVKIRQRALVRKKRIAACLGGEQTRVLLSNLKEQRREADREAARLLAQQCTRGGNPRE